MPRTKACDASAGTVTVDDGCASSHGVWSRSPTGSSCGRSTGCARTSATRARTATRRSIRSRPRWSSSAGPTRSWSTSNGGILAGHGRLLAARKLGLAEVPVIRFEHLSEAQKRAYLIADNQLALQAGWERGAAGARSWPGCGTSASTSTWSASMPPSWSGCWRSPTARRRATRPRTRSRSRRRSRSASRATSGSWATTACCAATPRCWPTSSGCSAGSSRT